MVLAACALLWSAPAFAEGPSAALIAMRDRFESEVLKIEDDYIGDAEGLRRALEPAAQRIFGADWSVVRAEAERSLRALPEIDLSVYAGATLGQTPFADLGDALNMTDPNPSPAMFAMVRFYDASSVAILAATSIVRLPASELGVYDIGIRMSLVPLRAYRGRFEGRDVLAARYMRSMVITPYEITPEGIIMPDMAHARVFALHR